MKGQEETASAIVEAALARISSRNPELNCFTEVTASRARTQAQAIDRAIASGIDPGPLAGVPFAVKNLFDIQGLRTLAGSRINRDKSSAVSDATAVEALTNAGAILLGALNMDEYALGITTENTHYGPTRNPHDPLRVAGGSSGGSAASVAAGLVPLALGSDTNGSMRVPAALCGTFALKPTYGRISRAGTQLFSSSLDHVGPFARSAADIALAFDVLQGPDSRDPVCSKRQADPLVPQLERGSDGLRFATAGGFFGERIAEEVISALDAVTQALGVEQEVELPEVHRVAPASFIITGVEASNLHLESVRNRQRDFDPMTRDRFIAGALLPANWYAQAQRFRRWFRDRVAEIFDDVDVLVLPTTPCVAPFIDATTVIINDVEYPKRPPLSRLAQPFSFIGWPALVVPVASPSSLPVSIQFVGRPFEEANLLRVGRMLEDRGLAQASIAV